MNTTFDPYARNVARETLHGHRGLLDSIEPEDETLPCGEVVSTQREGDGLVVSVRWDGSDSECTYVLTVEAAPPVKGNGTDTAERPTTRERTTTMHHGYYSYLSYCANQARRDNQPCPSCGGDRLRPDFTGSGACHVPYPTRKG